MELSGSRATTRYVYSDHLGSVDVITNAAGLLEQKLSFDAFGKRRAVFNLNNQPVALTLAAILNLTHRGFTGHLQVDHANVIHMGGRIYDAHIGRFLQADPFVQAPNNSQNHNRYSYVLNNPLSYTDPSGYFFKKLKQFAGVIVAVAGSIVCPACSPMLIGAIAGAVSAAVNGGSIIKGAVIGAFSAAAFGAVGETWAAGTFGNVMGNAVVGGFMNSLQGGKFGHGFLSAGFSAAFKPGINKIGDGAASHSAHRIVAAAVVGGTASKLSGDKFANGAVTGAFSQAFNGEETLKRERELGLGYPFGKESAETLEGNYPDILAEAEDKLNRVQVNYVLGKSAESEAAAFFRSEYNAFVLEGGVTLSVDGTLRYPDLTVQYPDGTWEFVEVKSGGSRLVKQQIRLDRIIQTKGAIVLQSSRNASLVPQTFGPTNVELARVYLVRP